SASSSASAAGSPRRQTRRRFRRRCETGPRMIPLRDVIPSRTVPYITITLIVLNALAWFYELTIPEDALPAFLQIYGVVPGDFSTPTLLTSMFLHGSWSH